MNKLNSDVSLNFSTATERSTITAVFPDRASARHSIDDLKAFGLRADQIGVAMRDRRQQEQLIADTGIRAVDGAIGAGVLGALLGMQIPESAAVQQESEQRKGSVLVMAKVYENVAEAQRLIQQYGGRLVNRLEQPTISEARAA